MQLNREELLKKIHIDNELNRNIYLPNIKDTFMYKINDKNEWYHISEPDDLKNVNDNIKI